MAIYRQKFDAKRYWANKPLCSVCKSHKVKNGTVCHECLKRSTQATVAKVSYNVGDDEQDEIETENLETTTKIISRSGPVSQKATDVFRKYQQQAIDFSRRNRLLKYPAKATKIEFNLKLDECEEYFGTIQELSTVFPHKKVLDSEKKQEKLIEEEEREELFDPRTTIIGKKLISCLDKLRLQAKKNFEEHGLNTLFLVIGEVKWKEQTVGRGSTDAVRVQDYSAPLLLIPIELENSREPYKATTLRLNVDQDPIRVNPVLLSFMRQNLEIRTPDLPEDLSEISYGEIRGILSDLTKIFKDKGITIETSENLYVGQFSFHGQQIYEDLHKNETEIIQHPYIYGVCSGDSFDAKTEDHIEMDEDYNSDEFLNAEEDFTILDADSSQIVAIKKIMSGDHMVIHGPPGTGKSQTIANVISNLLARGKTVLFVCEKQVALDVVYKRLSSGSGASVADLCLPLFKYASDKKQFAADIINSRESVIREIKKNKSSDLDQRLVARKGRIDFLTKYAEEVIKRIEPLGKNLYWIFGQLGNIPERSKELSISWKADLNPVELSANDFSNHIQALKELNPFTNFLSESGNQWNGLKKRHFSPDFAARVIDALKKFSSHMQSSPYHKFDIKYLSWGKAFNLHGLVSDEKFLRSLKENSLKIELVQEEYLERFKNDIQPLLVLSEKYQSLNKDNKFKFAEKWQSARELATLAIKSDIPLESIYSLPFTKSVEWLADSSEKLSAGLPTSISDLSIKEFDARAFLFLIDHNLAPITSKSKTDLYDLSNQIKQLQVIHIQFQQSQEILDKYGINLGDIQEQEVFRLENTFTQKYKTFFRVFSSGYKKERALVTSWCGLVKPESYGEVKSVSFAAATRLKLQSRISSNWQKIEQKFGLNSEARKLPLPYFVQKIELLVKYLENNSLEFVEPYIQKLLLDEKKNAVLSGKAQAITKILSEYQKIQQYLLIDISDQKVFDLEGSLRSLSEEMLSVKGRSEVIANFAEYHKDILVQEVVEDTVALNNLKEVINEAKKLDPAKYTSESLEAILTSAELSAKMRTLLDLLLGASKNISETKFNDLESLSLYISQHQDVVSIWNSGFNALMSELSILFENENLSDIYLSYPIETFINLLTSLAQDREGLELWIEYQKQRHLNEELGLGWFINELALKTKDTNYRIDEVYMWVFLSKWLEDYFKERPILRDFNKQKYEQVIEEFKKLESESLDMNRPRILREFLSKLESSKNYGGDAERVLKREAEKKRQHVPIRTLVRNHAHHLQDIKPCWMVSPLALGSYLEYGTVDFDVVIFDEASQMRIENALGAISRAKQVVVIGDEHQLPPTPFFGFSLEDEEEDDDVAEETGFESILQRSISLLNGSEEKLKYHYRSASEDLIAFSNHYIYDGQLVTFPNAIKRLDQGVHFEFVKDGVYEGGKDGSKTNPKEAERVADLCIKLAEENNGSLGVIAFSKSQERAIRSALEERIKSRPHLAEKLDETSTERDSFFIKNLESVQGDERDRIILSVCYGPDKATGKIRNHFGPINQNSGYRRLNVAVTRARQQLICVASMHAYDMHPPENTFGAKLLQNYLEYAEKGQSSLEASKIAGVNSGVEADSDFELSVEAELVRRGYTVHRQVGASGFKIDLAIVNPKNNNEYILGIECDGAAYHSTKSARIRDRIRQDVLENLGWKIYRIWSQHWFSHKSDIIDDIINQCHLYR